MSEFAYTYVLRCSDGKLFHLLKTAESVQYSLELWLRLPRDLEKLNGHRVRSRRSSLPFRLFQLKEQEAILRLLSEPILTLLVKNGVEHILRMEIS